MFSRILVPVDGSDAGNQGLTEALRLAVCGVRPCDCCT